MRWFEHWPGVGWVENVASPLGLLGPALSLLALAVLLSPIWVPYCIYRHYHQQAIYRNAQRIERERQEFYHDQVLGTLKVKKEWDEYREEHKPYCQSYGQVPEVASNFCGIGSRRVKIQDVERGVIDDEGIIWGLDYYEGHKKNWRGPSPGRSVWFARSILGHKVYKPPYRLLWFSEVTALQYAIGQERERSSGGNRGRLADLKRTFERVVKRGYHSLFVLKCPLRSGESRFVYLDQFYSPPDPEGYGALAEAYARGERPQLLAEVTLPIQQAYKSQVDGRWNFKAPVPSVVCLSPNGKWLAFGGPTARAACLYPGPWSHKINVVLFQSSSQEAEVVVKSRLGIGYGVLWAVWLTDGRLAYGDSQHGTVRAVDSQRFGLGGPESADRR